MTLNDSLFLALPLSMLNMAHLCNQKDTVEMMEGDFYG